MKQYKTKRKSKKNRRSRKVSRRYKAIGGNTSTINSKTAVVYILNANAGFFAVYSSLWRVYMYAKKQNLPFFIEHQNWQYTYKEGWHDYFKSLNVFNNDDKYENIERFENNPMNDIIKGLTVKEYIEALKETFILQDYLQEFIDSYIKNELNNNYTSIYVRRGDKVDEMELLSLDKILAQTNITDDGRTIFVQTDDYSIVNEMKAKFPSCKIMTLTKEIAKGSRNNDMLNWTPEERKEHTDELLQSCVISARANIGWTYYMSNVGTFIKLLGYDTMNIYIDGKHPKESVDNAFKLDHVGPPGVI